jgi:hypothetical protein
MCNMALLFKNSENTKKWYIYIFLKAKKLISYRRYLNLG